MPGAQYAVRPSAGPSRVKPLCACDMVSCSWCCLAPRALAVALSLHAVRATQRAGSFHADHGVHSLALPPVFACISYYR
eukprot:2931555-Prymnesium_polylepis.2